MPILALAKVRSGAHYGLKPDIAPSPKCANRRRKAGNRMLELYAIGRDLTSINLGYLEYI
jgi:hypothetical protein